MRRPFVFAICSVGLLLLPAMQAQADHDCCACENAVPLETACDSGPGITQAWCDAQTKAQGGDWDVCVFTPHAYCGEFDQCIPIVDEGFHSLCTSGGLPPCDDTTPSLGDYRVLVAPKFMSWLPSYMFENGRLVSGTLYDSETVIGRSWPHVENDLSDTGGSPVGSALRLISDSDFVVVPDDFERTRGREVHLELVSMNLSGGLYGAKIVAGSGNLSYPGLPVSPGEAEAKVKSVDPSDDFPARSFFNVYVEAYIPPPLDAWVYNPVDKPMLVVVDEEDAFPPRVVYVHGQTSPVPVYFKEADPEGQWAQDEFFGLLTLAGHGAGYSDDPDDVAEYEAIMAQQREMEIPTLTTWGAAVMILLVLAAGTVVFRKLRTVPA